jgi:hypothetical protein
MCVRVIGNDLFVRKRGAPRNPASYPRIGAILWRPRIAIISRSPLRLKNKTPPHESE